MHYDYLNSSGPSDVHGGVCHLDQELHDEVLEEVHRLRVRVPVVTVPVQHAT